MTYLSTSYRSADDVGTILEDVGENTPIRRVELSGGTSYDPELRSTLKRYKREYGFRYLLHNYFPPSKESFVLNIADPDEENRRRSIEFAKRSIEWSADLGAPHYTVHAGYPETLTVGDDGERFEPDEGASPPSPSTEARRRFRNAIEELLAVAKEHDIAVGVENLFPAPQLKARPLLCTPGEMTSLLHDFGDESAFGLLLDVGHLNVAAAAFNFDTKTAANSIAEDYKEQILELHVSYNRGENDEHDLVPPDSWMAEWLAGQKLESVPVTYEARGYAVADVLANLDELGITYE